MTTPFLLQMAGAPGSGKSALARLIGRCTGAVVIDKDVLKTAAIEAGVDDDAHAGGIAYEAFFALADHLLGQGFSVVLDSPSFWASVPTKGAGIAAGRELAYYFIECMCPDQEGLTRRLRERPRLRSNPGEETLHAGWETMPPPGPYLRIDTTQPLERCLQLALEYLGRSES